MFIVTGMHRSGTSLVARLLYEGGADLGDPTQFIAADRWNPDGYYEQADVININQQLIHGPFGKLAYFALPGDATIQRRAQRTSNEIKRVASENENKFVKDCRFCLTLPAWRQHGVEPRSVLICLRHPFEVALSLRRRNKITMHQGYNLWLLHNSRLLDSLQGLRCHFTIYSNYLDVEKIREEIRLLGAFCNISFDANMVDKFVASVKPQNRLDNESDKKQLPEDVAILWDDLLSRMMSARYTQSIT